MTDTAPAIRKTTLARLMAMASVDETLAEWSARNYEALARAQGYDLFKGLHAKFTQDWRELKLAKERAK